MQFHHTYLQGFEYFNGVTSKSKRGASRTRGRAVDGKHERLASIRWSVFHTSNSNGRGIL